MILPKREDGFFPEREDLPLLEVTAETGLWYGLEVFCKKDVIRNFAKFTGKHLCHSLFLNKVVG